MPQYNKTYKIFNDLYVDSGSRAGMTEKTGLDFEPQSALDGGPDGLKFVNQIKASRIPAIIETIGGEIIEY